MFDFEIVRCDYSMDMKLMPRNLSNMLGVLLADELSKVYRGSTADGHTLHRHCYMILSDWLRMGCIRECSYRKIYDICDVPPGIDIKSLYKFMGK